MQWRLALSLTFALIATPVLADTASEVRQEILDNMTHMNQALNQDPMRISKLGSKEFFPAVACSMILAEPQPAMPLIFSRALVSISRLSCWLKDKRLSPTSIKRP
jgi:hypothetical protein